MQQQTHSPIGRHEVELWTRDDAKAWKEAEVFLDSRMALDEDPLLDNDLWMNADTTETISISCQGRLQLCH